MVSMMKRGEVYWANFDPTIGAEIRKTRPCVIISNELANQFSPLVTVLPITSQKLDKIYKHEVLISNDAKLKNSKIKINQIRTFDKQRIGKLITKISSSVLEQVDESIMLHLGLKKLK